MPPVLPTENIARNAALRDFDLALCRFGLPTIIVKYALLDEDNGFFNELPLYGLPALRQPFLSTVFVHEGAKSAWFLSQPEYQRTEYWRKHKLITESDGEWRDWCPWSAELNGNSLQQVAHIGWPGGAPNPHRVNWGPLKRLAPRVKVILVVDHDAPGESAVGYISKELQRRLWALRFGGDFPRNFDLSDPFPETLYEEVAGGVKRYRRDAPAFESCLDPATWATKPNMRLRAEFIEDWLYSVKPAIFVNRGALYKHYNESEFNALIAPFTHGHISNVATILRREFWCQANTVAYDPSRKSGRINYKDGQAINVFVPSNVEAQSGDREPWIEFLTYLVPNKRDRENLMRWIATLIAKPEIRMMYSVLAVSEQQGVGKTTLADILVHLVGLHNCSFPSAEAITDRPYTSWMIYKRLVIVAEIYAGHSAKTANKLKAYLTDKHIDAEEKYLRAFTVANWAHAFATSNSYSAIKLDVNDRRWFVPGITEKKRERVYFAGFRLWLENGGYNIIMDWARRYGDYVLPGEEAPDSSAKHRSISETYQEGERLIYNLGMAMKLLGERKKIREDNGIKIVEDDPVRIAAKLDDIRDMLAKKKVLLDPRKYGGDGHNFLETPKKIAAILRNSCRLWVPSDLASTASGFGSLRISMSRRLLEEPRTNGDRSRNGTGIWLGSNANCRCKFVLCPRSTPLIPETFPGTIFPPLFLPEGDIG